MATVSVKNRPQVTSVRIVGPTFPLKGGVAQHTTELAERLSERSVDAQIDSWAAQYPSRLYPGTQEVATSGRPFEPTTRRLKWYSPWSWWKVGRDSRQADLLALALVTPFQIPAYLSMLAARGRRRSAVIAHNVLPHEPQPWDKPLVRALLSQTDLVITHTPAEADRARQSGAKAVAVAPLPPHFPTQATDNRSGSKVHRSILFFGLVRDYKGLDDLLAALVAVPDVRLTVAGEIWGSQEELEASIDELGLSDRVTLTGGYVDDADIPSLFADHDLLVLPYRSGTASQHALLAHRLGLPVLATRVGSFPAQITDGGNGLLVDPEDPEALAEAIASMLEPEQLERLRGDLPPPDASAEAWSLYLDKLLDPSPATVSNNEST